MGLNIEIKARCESLEKVQELLNTIDVRFEGSDHQVDTFFNVPEGRLKLRESTLYGALLIPYFRADQKGPKAAEYALLKTDEPLAAKNLLQRMMGIRLVVDKQRLVYHYQNVRIHLDTVKKLGTFIEFEAVSDGSDDSTENTAKVNFLMKTLGISRDDLVPSAYADLLTNLK